MYHGVSTLYKDPVEQIYILAITAAEYSGSEFNRICNMFTEYASLEKADGVTLAFLEEHCTLMISQTAVEQLALF
jgi:adapter protein MecA 1/2